MSRICIKFGDLWKGRQMATSYNYPILFCECAMLIKKLNLLQVNIKFLIQYYKYEFKTLQLSKVLD